MDLAVVLALVQLFKKPLYHFSEGRMRKQRNGEPNTSSSREVEEYTPSEVPSRRLTMEGCFGGFNEVLEAHHVHKRYIISVL